MSTTYWRRQAAGLCPRCEAPASPGHVLCEACMQQDLGGQPRQRQPTATTARPGWEPGVWVAQGGQWVRVR
jgi:hypothetical protein